MESPSTLNDIFGMNPGAFTMAQPMLDRAATGADIGNQQAQQTLDFGAQDQPFNLARLGLQNQTSAASLPGIQATSDMNVRKNSNQALTNDAQVKSELAKLDTETRQNHITDTINAGTTLQAQADRLYYNPVGGMQAAKDAIQQDYPQLWRPEYDNMDTGDLIKTLHNTGKGLTEAGNQYQLLHAQMEAKNDRDIQLENVKQLGRVALRDSINSNAQKIEAAREADKDKLNKQTSEQYAVTMGREADRAEASGDAETAATLRAKANQWLTESRFKAAASAGVTAATKPSLGAMAGIPTNPPAAPPAIGPTNPASAPPTNPPSAPASAARMGIKANSAAGQDWITQALAHNPGMSVDDIVAQGKKSGRLTD